jgi:hypothetical protein
MKINIDANELVNRKLSVDQFVLLVLIHNKEFNLIENLYTVEKALEIRNSLTDTEYMLSKNDIKFKETIISKSNVGKMLGIRSDKINFWEFYNVYPIRHGNRVLRAANPDSQLAIKHEKKYLLRIKLQKNHEKAVKAIEAFVAKQRLVGKLQYLPAMETVLNNALWEQWEGFIQTIGDEGAGWNTTTI